MSKTVSDKQIWFMNKLAAEKLPNGQADLDAMIAAIPGFIETGGGRDGLASRMIDRLMSLPKVASTTSASPARSAGPKVDPPEGVHLLNGSYYKVQTSATGNRYAKRLVNRTWEYEGRRGDFHQLSEATVLTAEQAGEFGLTHGWCIFCSIDLTDERSLTVGYGPVCAKKRSLPWGTVAARLTTPPATTEPTVAPAPIGEGGSDFSAQAARQLAETDALLQDVHRSAALGLADRLFNA